MMQSFLNGQKAQTASNDDASLAQSEADPAQNQRTLSTLPAELLCHIFQFLPAFENLQLREVSNLFCSIWETVAKKQLPITIPAMRELTPEQAEKFLHTKQQAEISYLTNNESLILNKQGLEKILDRFKVLRENNSAVANYAKEKCLNSFNDIIIRNGIANSRCGVLFLSRSFLTRFPEELFSDATLNTFWADLRLLDLENNQLTTLPDALGRCPSLWGLMVNNNKLTTLPDSIGQCITLTWLNVKSNKLITLPEVIGKCVALASLDLSNNELTSLPESIAQCTLLRYLSITKNRLKQLPTNLPGNITFFDEKSNVIDEARCLELQEPTLVENEETQEPPPKRRRR